MTAVVMDADSTRFDIRSGGASQPAASDVQLEEEIKSAVALFLAGWDPWTACPPVTPVCEAATLGSRQASPRRRVGAAILLVSNLVFPLSALALISVQMVLSLA